MRVVLSGGGTAGHINPALALAEVLEERGCEVVFAGTPKGVESRLVPQAGIEFVSFEAAGFNRNHPTSIFKALSMQLRSTKKAQAWFNEIKPDIVVGFGGYVSIPVSHAAEKMGIPFVIHEQNSVMGMANKYLSKRARKVCVTYDCSAGPVADKSRVVLTGNPVRRKVLTADRAEGREMLGIPQDARMLLVFGGSLGARHINQAISSMKNELLAIDDLYIVHITGPKELETVQNDLNLTEQEAKRYIVMGYQDRMGETLAATDFIVSRAGATSLAEISARAIPAILVPFPFATEDHQTTNARAYVDAGCARMIADDNVESQEFQEMVLDLIRNEELCAEMTRAARDQKTADAAVKLADVVMAAANQ